MLKTHLFICTNGVGIAGKCGHKNSEILHRKVKEHFKNRPKLANEEEVELRINKAGCLGHCENGIAAVIYPQNEWFLDLTENDENTLIAAVEKALK